MHRAHHRHTVLDLCKATVYSLLTFLPTLPKLCSQFACHKIVKKKKTTEQKKYICNTFTYEHSNPHTRTSFTHATRSQKTFTASSHISIR